MAKCNNTSACEVCGKRWSCSCQCVEYTSDGKTIALCRDCMSKGNTKPNSNSDNNISTNDSNKDSSSLGVKISNILIKTIKWK